MCKLKPVPKLSQQLSIARSLKQPGQPAIGEQLSKPHFINMIWKHLKSHHPETALRSILPTAHVHLYTDKCVLPAFLSSPQNISQRGH